jgi:hypothetical protein
MDGCVIPWRHRKTFVPEIVWSSLAIALDSVGAKDVMYGKRNREGSPSILLRVYCNITLSRTQS